MATRKVTLMLTTDTLGSARMSQLGEVPTVEGQLDRAAVAALLGVSPSTVTRYLSWSASGRPYAGDPFPAPDGRFGDRPYWRTDRAEEITEWAARHPRQGVGGPKKRI